jgi:hypothetical protein
MVLYFGMRNPNRFGDLKEEGAGLFFLIKERDTAILQSRKPCALDDGPGTSSWSSPIPENDTEQQNEAKDSKRAKVSPDRAMCEELRQYLCVLGALLPFPLCMQPQSPVESPWKV